MCATVCSRESAHESQLVCMCATACMNKSTYGNKHVCMSDSTYESKRMCMCATACTYMSEEKLKEYAEVAQWVKVLADKLAHLSLSSRTHVAERETWCLQTVLWPPYVCCGTRTHTQRNIEVNINVINIGIENCVSISSFLSLVGSFHLLPSTGLKLLHRVDRRFP